MVAASSAVTPVELTATISSWPTRSVRLSRLTRRAQSEGVDGTDVGVGVALRPPLGVVVPAGPDGEPVVDGVVGADTLGAGLDDEGPGPAAGPSQAQRPRTRAAKPTLGHQRVKTDRAITDLLFRSVPRRAACWPRGSREP
jgi:hypothetical protein